MASRKEGTGSAATSSSSTTGAAGKGKGKAGSGDSAVKQVQIDGLVVLKIIKHYQEEGQGTEVVQGVLLGLVVEDRLEITNCFPFPQHTEDDADFDEVQYQMEMMRSLRHVNIDHLHVGWYQSTYYGSFVTRALLDSQFSYQHAIEESVVLIYDPIKTAQGSLSLKAYRLTPKLMEVCKEKDFSPEALKKGNITFEHMFEEVPIVIKNSHLINVLMWELEKKSAVADKHELLSLASSHLGKTLQLLMDRVDEMSQDIVKYNTYMRNTSKQQQQKHQYQQRRQQENMQRQSRGEPPLPEEDLSKLFKPHQPPARMDSLLIAGQINTYCQNIKEFTAQNLGKLFMAQALQEYNS
ncbi:eukaryotic translation initiation factor 3 subunit H isoform X2 [Lagenorhynchus albirostris]|uniref:Eukaryotic translation initiation factor 3 subunit H n=1 Tax=Tursiops truncatus TaxID=9739 RepID=A0A2U4B379_TURTR|nr:eukaryotic translation initiation factor 3 subunit H isoform X2 [Tursiops truncatus]XP_026948329.1 eukaryotic translation initiation factor 3 subunit H isoform X2 [Lagenorhynchus obliquidens]XP_030731506.1 eukaryotic translation initiation factor 3 subunit H isoform X2 [Globicephala melas]XP_059851069.1 eukaryotic translation initiation factor 3 subunit H isoform X2 [Delphinus delphis]XP_059984137.1 eukaryotic translation initiation factor 3 subunit H isoform X2 [Lagenorhynchus albirostris]